MLKYTEDMDYKVCLHFKHIECSHQQKEDGKGDLLYQAMAFIVPCKEGRERGEGGSGKLRQCLYSLLLTMPTGTDM